MSECFKEIKELKIMSGNYLDLHYSENINGEYSNYAENMDEEYPDSDLAPYYNCIDEMDKEYLCDEILTNNRYSTFLNSGDNNYFKGKRKGITPLQLENIWEVSELHYLNEITKDEALNRMVWVNMNKYKTSFCISTYALMLDGKPIAYSIYSEVIDLFLTKIKEIYGSDKCALAIKSVADYFKGSQSPKIEKILFEHSSNL